MKLTLLSSCAWGHAGQDFPFVAFFAFLLLTSFSSDLTYTLDLSACLTACDYSTWSSKISDSLLFKSIKFSFICIVLLIMDFVRKQLYRNTSIKNFIYLSQSRRWWGKPPWDDMRKKPWEEPDPKGNSILSSFCFSLAYKTV